jgi:AAA domain
VSSTDGLAAATLIRTLLSGGSPDSSPPEAFGEFRDIVDILVTAFTSGGTSKVREAWNDLLRRHPSLVELAAADAPQGEGWRLFTLADAYLPRPPEQYVVDGLFSLPSLSIVYGPPGTLKSLLLADMTVCIAAGLEWLRPLPNTTAIPRRTCQSSTLWCDFDNGPRRTHERFSALGRAYAIPATAPLRYVSMPSPWLDAGNIDTLKLLTECMQTVAAKLVVIDNLCNVKGKADENSAEMGSVMARFRRLAEELGAAVVLIHHQRKESGTNSRAGDRLRGHSSIEAALDLALLVERKAHAESVILHSTKARGVEVLPFGALLTYEHQPGSTELARAQFFGLSAEDKVSDRAIEQAVIEVVKAQPLINKTELINKVKTAFPEIGMNRISGVIDCLVLPKKKLKTKSGDRGAKRYEVA